MHIAIAGNIGSGKTTLTSLLARYFGWEPKYEAVTYNPYLEDYYKDIARWSFCLETYFLKERFRDVLEINSQPDKIIIQDRSIFEGVYVFVANNKAQGNMSDRDFETYMNLFHLMTRVTKTPDLMVYLRASVPHLISHIQKRGRDYEKGIQLDYLKGLNDRYEDFIYNKYNGKVMTIETDDMDFVENPGDFQLIADRINGYLFGLFPSGKNS